MTHEREPLVVGLEMGYGHMRPAHALAAAADTVPLAAGGVELCGPEERRLWARIQHTYESTTRWSSKPLVGPPFRWLVDWLTDIEPLLPERDQSHPSFPVRRLARAIDDGLGRRLVEVLRESGRPLVATHFAPALAADAAGCERVYCVVTDSDIHRIWAARDAARTNIRYLLPSERARSRLLAYGVPRERLFVTGYPLPGELLGGEDLGVLKRHLARRLARLDPNGRFRSERAAELRQELGPLPELEEGERSARVTFAVGGAGAQVDVIERALPSLAPAIAAGRLQLALVAGVRAPVRARLERIARKCGVHERVEILHAPTLAEYFPRFNELLARTDVLWTKPSEMTFFGALGLALVLSEPVGAHESYNLRWAREQGAALEQGDPRRAGEWMLDWIADGRLAAAAWTGYARLPKLGLFNILRCVRSDGAEGWNTRLHSGKETLL